MAAPAIEERLLHAPRTHVEFSRGLCSCCASPGGVGRCCLAFWCFPCAFGCLVASLSPKEIICGKNFTGGCLLACLASAFSVPCLVITPARMSVRKKFGIPEDVCTDAICGVCCAPCVLIQMMNEVDISKTASRAY